MENIHTLDIGTNTNPFDPSLINEDYLVVKSFFKRTSNQHLIDLLTYLDSTAPQLWVTDKIESLNTPSEKQLIINYQLVIDNYKKYLINTLKIDNDELFILKKLTELLNNNQVKQNIVLNKELVYTFVRYTLSDGVLTNDEISLIEELSKCLSIDKSEILSILTHEITPTINEIKNNIFINIDKKFELIQKFYTLISNENIKFNQSDLFEVINKINQHKYLKNESLISIKINLNGSKGSPPHDLYYCFDLEFGKLRKIEGYDRVELKPARIIFTSNNLFIYFKYSFSDHLSGESHIVNLSEINSFQKNHFNNTGQSYINYSRKGDRKPWIISGFKEDVIQDLIYSFLSPGSVDSSYTDSTTERKEKITLSEDSKTNNKDLETISPFKELENMIGLDSVKDEIYSLVNLIKTQNLRKKQGLKIVDVSLHSVFTGSPGTGKTTVARLYSSILKELGVLKKGHLTEVDRTELVAGYLGQTAIKVEEVVNKALDGVLFIDEAYSLIGKNGDTYGDEAINTLLKRMEDDRKRLVVIVAGYTDKMQDFINSNPGLKSRFNRFIEFPDYSTEELLQIFTKMIESNQYKLTENAVIKLSETIKSHVSKKIKVLVMGDMLEIYLK